ncbi:hypothetical protein KAI68_03250 [bacterium]|nr:hypothetical protein [bacterium]
MDNFTGKMENERNKWQVLTEKIPGYGGYKDRERRRDADKLIRDFLSKQLNQGKESIAQIASERVEKQQLSGIDRIDRLTKKMEKIADKIRFANYGYSGFFDQVKIDAEKLDDICRFDYSLIEKVEELKKMIEAVKEDATEEKISLLSEKIENLDDIFSEREKGIIT